MAIYVKVAGVWKQVTNVYEKVAGTWKASTQAYTRVATVWKSLLSFVAITNQSIFGTTKAGYQLDNAGVAKKNVDSVYTSISGEWLVTGAVGDYECRATLVSGTSPSGDSLATWLALSTSREWYLSTPTLGQYLVCTLTIEIRRTYDLVVLATATVDLDSDHR